MKKLFAVLAALILLAMTSCGGGGGGGSSNGDGSVDTSTTTTSSTSSTSTSTTSTSSTISTSSSTTITSTSTTTTTTNTTTTTTGSASTYITNVKGISAGDAHSLAVKNDGTAWAWGNNIFGQLGNGTTTNVYTPVQVIGLTGITAIAAGFTGHSVALKSDGTVWAWGSNGTGQLGDGTTVYKYTPVQVIGLTGITAIAAGNSYSVALKNDGTVWAWGWNPSGQLGNGTTANAYTPVQVIGLTGVKAISAAGSGGVHTVAITNDDTIWVWGDNSVGQLGDGTTTDAYIPKKVIGLTGVKAISAGRWFTVALKMTVLCGLGM